MCQETNIIKNMGRIFCLLILKVCLAFECLVMKRSTLWQTSLASLVVCLPTISFKEYATILYYTIGVIFIQVALKKNLIYL